MSVTLLLRCFDLNQTREHYGARLGFAVEEAPGTVTVSLHSGRVAFTEHDLWQRAPACSATIRFDVPDVDAYFRDVRDRVDIRWPLQDTPHGTREFGVVDCNGYHLAFRQQDAG